MRKLHSQIYRRDEKDLSGIIGLIEVVDTDPATQKTKQQALYWDKSTAVIKEEGSPADPKEIPAKPADIKKGSMLYVTIVEGSAKAGKLRLDRVSIKP